MTAKKKAEAVPLRAAPKPGQCVQFVRSEVAREMPAICAELTKRVKRGDMAVLKMLWQMGMFEKVAAGKTAERAGVSFVRRTLREVRGDGPAK